MPQYCIIVTQTRSTETFVEADSPEQAQLLIANEYVSRCRDTTADEWANASLSIVTRKI